MAEYKTYEYIWLDGNKPESSMRSKVKATDADTPPDWKAFHVFGKFPVFICLP